MTKVIYMLLLASVGFAQNSYVDSLRALRPAMHGDTHRVNLLRDLGDAQERKDSAIALEYYRKSATLARTLSHHEGLAIVYSRMATLHFLNSNFDNVHRYVDSSLYFLHKIGEPRKLAEAYLTRANIHLTLGNYQQALNDCLSAETHARRSKDKGALAHIFQLQANIYRSQNQLNSAMEFQDKSITLFRELGDRIEEGRALYTSAMLLLRMQKTQEARRVIHTAIGIADSAKNYAHMATYRQVLTEILLDERKYAEAEATATQALSYAQRSNSREVRGYVLEVFALLHAAQQNHAETVRYALAAYPIFESAKDPWHQRKLASILADTYEKMGKPDRALHYQKIFNQWNDYLLHQELDTETEHLQLQFRYREKDNEVKLLAQEKELQEQRLVRQTMVSLFTGMLAFLLLGGIILLRNRSRLKHQIQELRLRNHIASDLHDEVGSSLSSIHLLSQMIRNQPESAKRTELFETMSRNAKETVDRITDIVWVVKPEENEKGSLRERIERFAYDICSSAGIELELNISDIRKDTLTMEQRKNLYLIFKEAVNNAVKYSGTEKLRVELIQNGKEMTLIVEDQGRGFDPQTVPKGNGLNNMEKRAKELKATLVISSREGGGTVIRLTMMV